MTRTEWARIAAEVNMLWPNARWSAETIRAGEGLLLDLAPMPVMAAVHDLATQGRDFPPAPGLIRKRSIELSAAAEGNGSPDVDAALTEVYAMIARVGIYRTPEWSHPAIGAAIDAFGGWPEVCNHENPEAFRAHFMRLYGTATARVEREALMPVAVRALLGALDLRADRELTP